MGRYSESFSIGKGTRQGCALSPLLFAKANETLAIAIRLNPDIKEVTCGNQEHKCALSNPTSTPMFLKILRVFSKVSGLRVNMNKSTALNITVPPDLLKQLSSNFAFVLAPAAIAYLGIKLTPDINTFFKANYPPMFHKCRGGMEKWSKCGLPGWVELMQLRTLLPHLLYLFCSLPIPIKKQFLSKFQLDIVRFVWGNKVYRCPSGVLFHLESQGGLGLPNL